MDEYRGRIVLWLYFQEHSDHAVTDIALSFASADLRYSQMTRRPSTPWVMRDILDRVWLDSSLAPLAECLLDRSAGRNYVILVHDIFRLDC